MVRPDTKGNNSISDDSGVLGKSLIDDAYLGASLLDNSDVLGVSQAIAKNNGNYDPFSSLNDSGTSTVKEASDDTTTNFNNLIINPFEQSSLFNQPIYNPPVALQPRSSKIKPSLVVTKITH